ncbi:response regulator [Dyadobacter sp. CY323]|uniref:response regulator n=1 Tax=Dyadobacter sp. CY323 TaxID=2907302 RepID=UPI001F29DDEF|nr:response regulator [Dyadobacter sp. CY323]MCE6987628.1 response regulator [Dyadobacter sp. CY323]
MEFIIVDDSVFDLFTQEKLLSKSGLASKVISFGAPQEALDYLFAQHETMPETIVLLDIQMPELNGFQFMEQFARIPEQVRSRIRIFMISSTVDPWDIAEAAANPHIVTLLSKPLDIPVLRTLLEKD